MPFVVFYTAWETLNGIAIAVVVDDVNRLSGAEQAVGADLVQDFAENPLVRDLGVFALIGGIGLIVTTVGAGTALRQHAGAPQSAAILIGVSGFLIMAHPPPTGPIGLAFVAVAVLIFVRSRAAGREPAPLEQPGPQRA